MSDGWDNDPLGEEPEPRGGRERGPGTQALAEKVLADERLVQDVTGTFWRFDGRCWGECHPDTLRALVYRADRALGGSGGLSRVREGVHRIGALAHDPDWSWGRLKDFEIGCWDGVLDLRSGRLRPHDADDRLESVIPWGYVPDRRGAIPVWERACRAWFAGGDAIEGGDALSAHDAVQEFFGYVCLPHAKLKRALMLLGPGDTGKTELCHALQALVGRQWCASLGVEQMDDPMVRWVLVGKRLNVITEITTDAMVADGGFKTLVSTEDPVLINPKNRTPYMYRPTAKHVIACNDLPVISDRSAATFKRLLVVPMRHKVVPEPGISAAIEAEMEGIFAWAVEGARRLLEAGGQFTEVGGAAELIAEVRSEQNPMFGFVEWCLDVRAGEGVKLIDLVDPYRSWSGDRSADVRKIGRMLRNAGFTVANKRYPNGRQAKSLHGYRLSGPYGRPADGPGEIP